MDEIKEIPKVNNAVKPVEVPVAPKKENNLTLIVIYLLYKTNVITRHGLTHMLEIVEKPFPENLAEWLLKESKK